MIHHMSFGVRDTSHVAHVLAELMGATAVRAPTPPFPYGAWLFCAGDDHGTFIEIVPATTVFDPAAPLGVRQVAVRSEPSAAHVLVGSPLDSESICMIATREGWRAEEVETGLFKVLKLWIDDLILVELLAHGEAARYVDAFGRKGMASLDRKLREMEAQLAGALSRKLPPQVLSEALGQPL